MALQPVVLDRHVLTLNVAGFIEAFAERGHIARAEGIRRPAVDKRDHRHARLLCVCRERPRDCRGAEKRDERASFHVSPKGPRLALCKA